MPKTVTGAPRSAAEKIWDISLVLGCEPEQLVRFVKTKGSRARELCKAAGLKKEEVNTANAKAALKCKEEMDIPFLIYLAAERVGVLEKDLRELYQVEGSRTKRICRELGLKLKHLSRSNLLAASKVRDKYRQHGRQIRKEINEQPDRPFTVVVEGDKELDPSLNGQHPLAPKSVQMSGSDSGGDAAPAAITQRPSIRYELFGFPVTAVLRFMGREGWNFADTRTALSKLGVECSDSTLRNQLRGGVKGDRGDPAELTKEQVKELEKAKKG